LPSGELFCCHTESHHLPQLMPVLSSKRG
jgi:hypothetical protein